jgi:hypothetical protein
VEMRLAPGVPYHSLPSPSMQPPENGPAIPALLLDITSEALALLMMSGQEEAGALAPRPEDGSESVYGSPRSVVVTLLSLLHVCVSAAAGRALVSPAVSGLWPPCALHVQAVACEDSGSAALSAGWNAAVALMQHAAAHWPLAKVHSRLPSSTASRVHDRKPVCSCRSRATAAPRRTSE